MFYKNFYRDIIILLVLFGGIAMLGYGLYKLVLSSTTFSSVAINRSTEEKIGSLIISQTINKQEGYYEIKNKSIDSSVTLLKNRLLESITSPAYKYKFYVVNNPEINAFTLPGGNIVIYSGLLQMADSAEQVTAVLAHEIGHAEKKHVVNKLIANLGLGVLISIITGADVGITTQLIQKLVEAKFDRSQEEEADLFALELLEKSNINPRQLAYFFKKMNAKGLNYDKRLELVMTHPNNDVRIKTAEEFKVNTNFKEKKIQINWKALVKTLKLKNS